MTDVFISYKREDETRVARITRALEKAGFQVWWDRGLPGGESWHANIASELAAARCVIVVWSHGSVAPEGHYVRDEARRGLARAVLAPVLIDKIKDVPLGFGETQAIDTLYRFVAATARAQTWSCSKTGTGSVCGFDGEADCALQERRQVARESCGAKR